MHDPHRRTRSSGTGPDAGCVPPGTHEAQPLHFLHIRKTGGTAFKHALQSAGESPGQSPVRGENSPYAVRLHGHDTRLRDLPRGEKFFFFVRDPISRFVSSFHSRRRWGRPRYFVPWSRQELEAFRRFSTPDRLASALSSANGEERAAAETAMRNIRHVGDGYWKWFESEDYFLSRLDDLFFIGFQPSLSADFEILKCRLQLPKGLSLPRDQVLSHASPRNLDRTLQELAVANLRMWYREDSRFLALCDSVIRENPHIRSRTGRPPRLDSGNPS